VDPATHKRYLDYRERHGYFAATTAVLTKEDFADKDREHRELDAKGEKRDDEEEARFEELSKLLLRD
jgi:hypothetical protein